MIEKMTAAVFGALCLLAVSAAGQSSSAAPTTGQVSNGFDPALVQQVDYRHYHHRYRHHRHYRHHHHHHGPIIRIVP